MARDFAAKFGDARRGDVASEPCVERLDGGVNDVGGRGEIRLTDAEGKDLLACSGQPGGHVVVLEGLSFLQLKDGRRDRGKQVCLRHGRQLHSLIH